MKLPRLATILLLCSPATAATAPRRLGPTLSPLTKTLSRITKTLSPLTKKPASRAGFLCLRLCFTRRSAAFLPTARASLLLPSLQFTIQTPSSL